MLLFIFFKDSPSILYETGLGSAVNDLTKQTPQHEAIIAKF